MNKHYDALEHITLEENSTFNTPPHLPELIHLDDMAVNFMIDFSHTEPPTVSPELPIQEALAEMRTHDLHMALVLDDNQHIVGLISTERVQGEKPYQLMQARKIKLSDIVTRMVMVPREKMVCLHFDTIRHARIGNIVETLKQAKRRYALVIKTNDEGQQTIVGCFSISLISKTLGTDVAGDQIEAQSISELQQQLSEFD